jgi:hypothetical protein
MPAIRTDQTAVRTVGRLVPNAVLSSLAALILVASALSGCVGTRTEADPDRHPSAAKRYEMRHFYDHRHRRHLPRHHHR